MRPDPSVSGFEHNPDLSISLPADFLPLAFKSALSKEALGILLIAFTELALQPSPADLIPLEALREQARANLGMNDPETFDHGLAELTRNGFVLLSQVNGKAYILPGTPAGRALAYAISEKQFIPADLNQADRPAEPGRPAIFRLHEENIGPLTPIITEALLQDQAEYPYDWIEDAVREAVLNNARSWKYVQAVLRNWKKKGRKAVNEKKPSDLEEFRKLYQEQKRGKRE